MKFGTDGIRGKFEDFNLEQFKQIGYFLGTAAKSRNVAIGNDSRESCKPLFDAIATGVNASGNIVVDCGVIPTPGLSFLTKDLDCGYGVQITASHNSAEYNGIKIFDLNGRKLSSSAQNLILYDSIHNSFEGNLNGTMIRNLSKKGRERYLEFILKNSGKNIGNGVRVAVDCANGATAGFAEELFFKLGFNPEIYNSGSGLINDECGSCYPEFIGQKVKNTNAYCGICFDGDGDRVIFCDEYGATISGDQLISFLALDLNKKNSLENKTVVLTDYSNLAVDEYLGWNGITVSRVANGDRNVMTEMIDNKYNLGGENSGHIIMNKFIGSGDALYSAAQILSRLDFSNFISNQLNLVKMNPQKLFNIPLSKKLNGDFVKFENLAEILKIEYNLDRVFVRESGTEPILRVLVEGDDLGKVGEVKKAFKNLLG